MRLLSRIRNTIGLGSACAGLLLCAVPAAADSAPHANGQPTGPGWHPVWSDEFDGPQLDPGKWHAEESCWGGGNNERQCYTDRPDNIRVEDGVLRLIARAETFTGPMYAQARQSGSDDVRTQAYTSGKVHTRGLEDWRYGRFSARMKLPAGQGTWPAFWMMPAESLYGDWPLSGEIDIMEAVNLETVCDDCPGGVERRTSGALHFGGSVPDNTYLYLKTDGTRLPGPSDEWRVYTLEWAEGVLQWLVDDQVFMRIEAADWYTDAAQGEDRHNAPFDQRFYLILNLAVGGNLPEKSNGGGFDPSAFPAELLVDWVRVERCAADPDSGRSCLTSQPWAGEPKGPWEVQAR